MKLRLWGLVMLWHCFSFAAHPSKEEIYQGIFDAVGHNKYEEFATSWSQAEEANITRKIVNKYEDRLKFTLLQRALAVPDINIEIVKTLLAAKADPKAELKRNIQKKKSPKSKIFNKKKDNEEKEPNIQLFKGNNSAHIVSRRQTDIKYLEILHEYQADFLSEDEGGWSSIAIAFSEGKIPLIQWFIGEFGLEDAVLRKAPNKDKSFYEQLLKDAKINFRYVEFDDNHFQLVRRGG